MALDQLVAAALLQYRAFGLLADEAHPAFKDDLTHFISAHGDPLVRAFSALSRSVPRQALAGLPFLLHSNNTAPHAPPGGYFDDQTPIELGKLLTSRYIFWAMQHNPDAALAVVFYLLRATLYVLHTRGFDTSVRYLLDLRKHGYLLNSSSLNHCLAFLFLVRQRVSSDDEIVPLCIAGQPHSAADWYNAELLPVDLQALPVLREAAEGMAYLVQTAGTDIDEVRASQSYDDWILGQHYLGSLMLTVHFILRYLNMDEEPAFRAFDVRYEEICADCFAFYHILRGEPERYPFEARFTASYGVIKAVEMGGGDWQNRLCDERVLVPDQLADLLLPSDGTINLQLEEASIPPAWRLLSSAVAPVYANLVVRNPDYRSLARVVKMNTNAASAPPDIRYFLRSMRQEPENEHLRGQLLDFYPYCDRWLFVEARYLDRRGDPSAAMARLQQAISIDPTDHSRWKSMSVILRKFGDERAADRLAGFARTLRNGRATAQ